MAAQSYSQGTITDQERVGHFRYRDSLYLYSEAKNLQDVLRKWTPREKHDVYPNFPIHFCSSLSLKCSDKISRKLVTSAYPINSLKVDVCFPRSNARI